METNKMNEQNEGINRRNFLIKTLLTGAGIAAISALPKGVNAETANPQGSPSSPAADLGKRRLGALEVSSVGLGCMVGSAFYLPFPGRDRMISVIRKAVESGVTLFFTCETKDLRQGRQDPIDRGRRY